MRIIGGTYKGKAIKTPANLPVRPTTDFAKEGLFNILNNRIDFEELSVLDLFCGTGNIALEFASRGASRVLGVDAHFACTRFVRETANALGMGTVLTEKADVFKFLASHTMRYDLIFADPPYDLATIPSIHQLVFERQLLQPGGWLIIEHGPKTKLDTCSFFAEHRKYGNVNFSFFNAPEQL